MGVSSASSDASTLSPTEVLAAERQKIRDHYDAIGPKREKWIRRNRYYYREMIRMLRFIIEPGKRVLQIRSDTGEFLEGVSPSRGVGIDVSQVLVEAAREKHPQFRFETQDLEFLDLDETFDYVLFSGIGETIDIVKAFQNLHSVITPDSRIVILNPNYLWQPLIKLCEKIGLKIPQLVQNWLTLPDIDNLLHLSGFELIKVHYQFLFPKRFPLLSGILNRFFARLPGLRRLCYMCVLVARPVVTQKAPDYSVSVIVPCKNEKGNIADAVERTPSMGSHTEIIFCDDQSTDGTAEEVKRMQQLYPEKDIRLVDGPGICKATNVWTGFDAAKGDLLMILDADLTTLPEELPYFYKALAEGRGDFINGSRMVYPMQDEAMRSLNILGNKFFSLAFSYLLSQTIKDTLCGTKVMWRRDYHRIKTLRNTWGVEDRWGDYELLFSASKLNLKIVDLPVHYFERIYGETKMTKRFKNGMIMLRMCIAALTRLKFV